MVDSNLGVLIFVLLVLLMVLLWLNCGIFGFCAIRICVFGLWVLFFVLRLVFWFGLMQVACWFVGFEIFTFCFVVVLVVWYFVGLFVLGFGFCVLGFNRFYYVVGWLVFCLTVCFVGCCGMGLCICVFVLACVVLFSA